EGGDAGVNGGKGEHQNGPTDAGGRKRGERAQPRLRDRFTSRPAAAKEPTFTGGEQGRERQRRELGEGRQSQQDTPFDRGGEENQRPDEECRDQRVVRVRLQGIVGEGVGGPGEAKDDAEAGPAEAAPKREEPRDGRQIERDRGGMRRRQV